MGAGVRVPAREEIAQQLLHFPQAQFPVDLDCRMARHDAQNAVQGGGGPSGAAVAPELPKDIEQQPCRVSPGEQGGNRFDHRGVRAELFNLEAEP
jgi:hypothetical protein